MAIDLKDVHFGMWLTEASRDELIEFILDIVYDVTGETNDNGETDNSPNNSFPILMYPQNSDDPRAITEKDMEDSFDPTSKSNSIRNLRDKTGITLFTAQKAVDDYLETLYS